MLTAALACSAQNKSMRDVYEEFRQQKKQEYADFRARANSRYAAFLRESWRKFQAMPVTPVPKDDDVPPVVMPDEDRDKPIDDRELTVKEVVPKVVPQPQPQPVSPIEETPQPVDNSVAFSYCGTPMKVRLDARAMNALPSCSGADVSTAWSELSARGATENAISDCLKLRDELSLNDWAYLNMLDSLAQKVYGKGNEATMLTAYIFCQSGYKMRLGNDNGKLVMLIGTRHLVYGRPYYVLDGYNFFPFDNVSDDLVLCDTAFPEEKPMSLLMTRQPRFACNATPEREFVSADMPQMKVKVSVNRNLIDFYNTYPTSMLGDNFMTRWAMYADMPLDERVKQQLYPVLRDNIKGLPKIDAANVLINFVQKALVYGNDNDMWGEDRAFFAEETLFYDFCDCEDHAILFTRLVRDLLGLKTALVYYPGHLASAVCFDADVPGDYINIDGKRFVIADPTFIGADVGRSMPDVDNATARVIVLD